MYMEIVDELAAQGRFCFSFAEMVERLDASPAAIRSALNRLKKKGVLALPYQEFYVILPPEHRARGCLPPQQFIPDLMEYLGEVYYAGLLTAAEFHGAAHHRPQVFQVVVAKARRPIECGQVRVDFIFRKNAANIPTEPRNTTAGIVKISTPEATALDLIGYVRHCAGLDNVATVLAELAEKMLRNSLDSFIHNDPKLSMAVLKDDDTIDDLNRDVFRRVVDRMKDNQRTIETGMGLIRISRNLERIADLSTNIAEEVIFIAQARIVKHGAGDK